ncbi:MAG TPA: UbiD family decarboxylase [Actinomycetota bacterium]
MIPRQDVRIFLEDYRARFPEDVLEIEEELDPDQDVTAIAMELESRGRAPLLVCPSVRGLSVPVVTNVFASRARVARLLGTTPAGLHDAYVAASARMERPRVVDDGPVMEVTEEGEGVDLRRIPMLTHFADDRGPYLTSAIVVAEDPATGVGNLSYHRSVLASPTTLATSLHSRGHLWRYLATAAERAQVLPVAVVVGGHPLFMLAASARVGIDVDERDIAGGLFGEPLEVVRTPMHGLAVPAASEFVLEGVIDPAANADEGPFGEFSGYSTSRSTNNLIQVSAVLRRSDPILVDVVSGNSADHLNLGRVPRESEMSARLRERFPDVERIEYPASGTHFHCYVAMRQGIPGMARQVALALLGWDPYLKLVVVVDDDVDLSRDEDVLWALATRFQADRDVIVVGGLPGSMLDPSSEGGATARLGLDATRGSGFTARRVALSDRAVARARDLLEHGG